MTLNEFNLKYLYKRDEHESWKECEIEDGLYRGDCEDYCLSLQLLVPTLKRYDLYHCFLNDREHCILGDGKNFVDCNIQAWKTKGQLERNGYTKIRKFWKIEIWYYKLTTKLFGRVPFL